MIRFIRARFAPAELTIDSNPKLAVWRIEFSFTGPVDPVSGMVVNLKLVDEWLDQIFLELSMGSHRSVQVQDWFRSLSNRWNEKGLQVKLEAVDLSNATTRLVLFDADSKTS